MCALCVLTFFLAAGSEIVLSIIVVAAGMSVLAWTWPKLIVWESPQLRLYFDFFFFYLSPLGGSVRQQHFRSFPLLSSSSNTHTPWPMGVSL